MGDNYLTLLRFGPDNEGHERGILRVISGGGLFPDAVFTTRENFTTLKYSSLRIGVYEMEHSMKTHNLDGTPSANPKKCLRPTDSRIISILIHAAASDDPDTLQGCIAPGTIKGIFSFTDSATAMKELFESLGDYEKGKKVTLQVLTNATGIGDETKETWRRTR